MYCLLVKEMVIQSSWYVNWEDRSSSHVESLCRLKFKESDMTSIVRGAGRESGSLKMLLLRLPARISFTISLSLFGRTSLQIAR